MTIAEKISAILREPATARINFRYAGIPVYGSGYARLAGAIERRHIRIRLSQSQQEARLMRSAGVARYDNPENTLYIPSIQYLETGKLHDRAQAVHEMTHALMDFHQTQMLIQQSEAASYIAQLMYVHNSGIDTLAKFYNFSANVTGNEASIFQDAWNIAHLILTTPGGYEVPVAYGHALETSIARHPLYRRHAQGYTNYDGIR